VPLEAIGEVDLFAAWLSERCGTLVADHADNLDPFRLRRAGTDEDALSHRGSVRERLRSEKPVDDYDVPPGHVVGVAERASSEDWRAKRFEVTWKHELKISRLKLTRVGERLLRSPTHRAESSGEGEGRGSSHAADPGQRSQSVLALAHQGGALSRRTP